MYLASIFNEVFGPVMVGPSSSHTAGPARIGLTLSQALPTQPQAITIRFDRRGSFASTYIAQGSNYGFVGGLLGLSPGDEKIKGALGLAKNQGIEVNFQVGDLLGAPHPNFAQIDITTSCGFHLVAEAVSTGGGAFEITSFQGNEVSIKGEAHELLFMGQVNISVLNQALKPFTDQGLGISLNPGPNLTNLKTDALPNGLLEALTAAVGTKPTYFSPVLPVVKKIRPQVPFTTSAEALCHPLAGERAAWRLATEYEKGLSGEGEEQIIERMIKLMRIMKNSALKGLAGDYKTRGFLPPQSPMLAEKAFPSPQQLDLGLLNKASLWSLGVMDYDICLGVVVAAPTAGSSGVIPGAVISVGEDLGRSEEEIAKALLVGGLVGVFIAHQGTFAAEMAGCQAEVGAASAMASASVVELMGGTPQKAFKAASLALQNTLGLICDPVCGVGNVPCVSRNASGVANALVSANMVLAGFDPFIPFDEVAIAMKNTGLMLPIELRCTGGGGLCQTKTALETGRNLALTP
ncbi:MAG: L-serine ammonia-lyase, iron-sulfur-dependent, subunit alpha [Deltaproteobacteria bacterium]|jgi:L-serine dehydratase|nr:L-serine ammonia-lyase, iron-sulfur-dependent, subunit alpha [Deltaproteobacteria bacterium]